MFKEGWIVVNEVPTHVYTWGCWIEDSFESDSVLVCITGNPGVPDFYVTFLSTLYSLIGIPIWVINFAGCEIPSNLSLLPSLKRNNHLYNLSGQVEHKYRFIKDYVPKSKSIYLIGHSVGAKIIMELLKRSDISDNEEEEQQSLGSRIKKAFLLFPTLEHIAKTKNGTVFTKFLQYLIPFVFPLMWLLTLLPYKIRQLLLRWYFTLRGGAHIDTPCMEGGMKVFNTKALRGSFFLAVDEMKTIKDLDHEVLNRYGHKLHCFYSRTDGWAPLEHYENLRRLYPKVRAEVVEDHIVHAFVLYTPREVAQRLSEEMRLHLEGGKEEEVEVGGNSTTLQMEEKEEVDEGSTLLQ